MNGKLPVRVYFPCTGLGHERRGFEAFTRECATAMRLESDVELTVFGGGGDVEPEECAVRNLPRASAAARIVFRWFRIDIDK